VLNWFAIVITSLSLEVLVNAVTSAELKDSFEIPSIALEPEVPAVPLEPDVPLVPELPAADSQAAPVNLYILLSNLLYSIEPSLTDPLALAISPIVGISNPSPGLILLSLSSTPPGEVILYDIWPNFFFLNRLNLSLFTDQYYLFKLGQYYSNPSLIISTLAATAIESLVLFTILIIREPCTIEKVGREYQIEVS